MTLYYDSLLMEIKTSGFGENRQNLYIGRNFNGRGRRKNIT